MKRILVISDIHGEIEKFEKLLEEAQYDARQDQLILLGDYVDRGSNAPSSFNSFTFSITARAFE
ncbi:metallophosphoesterase, partial [Bacillus sp. B-TM1]